MVSNPIFRSNLPLHTSPSVIALTQFVFDLTAKFLALRVKSCGSCH